VPCGNTLYTYSYTCQPSTVASILGQLRQLKSDKVQQSFGGHFTWSASSNVGQQKTVEISIKGL